MTLKFFPELLFKKIRQSVNKFFAQFDKIEKYLKNPTTGIQAIIYKGFHTANALLCGIYNSFIDIIAGLFSIIGFLFEGVAAMADFGANKADYGEMFLELMENMLEGILSFDYGDFLIRWIVFEVKTVIKMTDWVLENVTGASLESIAYYFGYIVGLIIDIIVETLLTGGTAAVAKLLESASAFIKNPLAKIEAGINKIVGATKKLLDKLIDFITFISARLKKGSEAIFTDLNKFIDEVFGFGEEVADNVLTPAERRLKKRDERRAKRRQRRNNEISLLNRGKYLGQSLSLDDLFKIEDYLQKIKVSFQLGEGKGAFKVHGYFTKSGNPVMMEAHNAAMFITDGKNMKLILRENATVYEFLHELMHLRDCQNIGKSAFIETSFVKREKLVYDKMIEHSKYLNREELEHAERYINKNYKDYGVTDNSGNPLKEKLPFDLKDIPKKRQGVNINTIINLK
jgi:hypothetical protein